MSGQTVDTSIVIAGSLRQHEHHNLAAPVLRSCTVLLGNCLAEAWSVLSRGVFRMPPSRVAELVEALLDAIPEVHAVSSDAFVEVVRTGRALGLAGNVHDAAIAAECRRRDLRLVTLDRGQFLLARALDVEVRLLGRT